WLENKFGDAIRAAAADVLGQPTQVRFVIDPELFQAARREQTEVEASRRTVGAPANAKLPCAADVAETRERTEPAAAPRLVGAAKRRWLRLSDFVVGACNRVAHASALSVIEEPGQGPNPLILHGPVGTGKSHLLQGIYAG